MPAVAPLRSWPRPDRMARLDHMFELEQDEEPIIDDIPTSVQLALSLKKRAELHLTIHTGAPGFGDEGTKPCRARHRKKSSRAEAQDLLAEKKAEHANANGPRKSESLLACLFLRR